MTTDLTNAPVGMPYQQYWDNEEYRDALRDEIADVITHSLPASPLDVADAIVATVFKRVKLHTWCDREGCLDERCGPTHYTFDITTHPRRFAPGEEDR